ncbi:MAG: CBS domain-containing protein, partial [Desulfobacterales bacterium]|nr:CBS domain-containing protein [Desulfobacterales bacterium]
VAALMVDNNFHTLPVVENSRLVGIIGKEDILRTLLPNLQGN